MLRLTCAASQISVGARYVRPGTSRVRLGQLSALSRDCLAMQAHQKEHASVSLAKHSYIYAASQPSVDCVLYMLKHCSGSAKNTVVCPA